MLGAVLSYSSSVDPRSNVFFLWVSARSVAGTYFKFPFSCCFESSFPSVVEIQSPFGLVMSFEALFEGDAYFQSSIFILMDKDTTLKAFESTVMY